MDSTLVFSPNQIDTMLEEELACGECGKRFQSGGMLAAHWKVHGPAATPDRSLLYQEVCRQRDQVPSSVRHPPHRRIYKPPSKRVGLTKIRMEDCLRCDACSCIYIDKEDYYKHMRNFHQKYNTVIPRIRKKSPERSVISESGLMLTRPVCLPPPEPIKVLLDTNIQESIKDRWSRVLSERLSGGVCKTEPWDEEPPHPLLQQVEVTIKTEPPDVPPY